MENLRDDNDFQIFKSDFFRCINIGSSNTGKTYFTTKILWPKIKHLYNRVYIFTKDFNEHDYIEAIPDAFIYTNTDRFYITDKVKLIIKEQHDNSYLDEDGKRRYLTNALIVFDDIIDKSLVGDISFTSSFGDIRHSNISIIFFAHHVNVVLSPFMKSNSNIIIINPILSPDVLEKLMDEFIIPPVYEEYFTKNTDEIPKKKDVIEKAHKIYLDYVIRRKKQHGRLIVEKLINKLYWL